MEQSNLFSNMLLLAQITLLQAFWIILYAELQPVMEMFVD